VLSKCSHAQRRWPVPYTHQTAQVQPIYVICRCAVTSGHAAERLCGVVCCARYEGVSPAGSHKPNTAVPQAYYNKLEGKGLACTGKAPHVHTLSSHG